MRVGAHTSVFNSINSPAERFGEMIKYLTRERIEGLVAALVAIGATALATAMVMTVILGFTRDTNDSRRVTQTTQQVTDVGTEIAQIDKDRIVNTIAQVDASGEIVAAVAVALDASTTRNKHHYKDGKVSWEEYIYANGNLSLDMVYYSQNGALLSLALYDMNGLRRWYTVFEQDGSQIFLLIGTLKSEE